MRKFYVFLSLVVGLIILVSGFVMEYMEVSIGDRGKPLEEPDHLYWNNILGTAGVVAVTMAGVLWVLRKRLKKANKSSLLKIMRGHVRFLSKAHIWFGYAAWTIIAIHGLFYLWTEWGHLRLWSGAVAFVILSVLMWSGSRMFADQRDRVRKKLKWHKQLALWMIIAMFIHAGGSMVMVLIAMGLYIIGAILFQRIKAHSKDSPANMKEY
ncbi:hypothetical protein GXN76_04335 [Kroppenstedtia pulmonis]|uniref:Ferric oxidoreductase domain-containing protein n=1 Tax=Kroppenstedtia pulmonis TaxID=1380685 RepID=A0A7D3XZP6_9BACL|nr:hypothetical protein [Kroppenstedtia pulmonis]QKG83780.1 hypothetical protein GXN76_04335 [Kroppenstedtia pulmonis]